MPIYSWVCRNCNTETEVERKMADIDKGPDSCSNCGQTILDRKPAHYNSRTKGFILQGDGWFRHGYQNWAKEKEKKK